ncbi:MAG: T9SS type A sorting domain-containing protein [Bacteroidetes bacterium]|nr:MAG: T9SS type A sorting domain-containing protein [Bacteroidota bacterium]
MKTKILFFIFLLTTSSLFAGNGTIFFTGGDISYFPGGSNIPTWVNNLGHTQLLSSGNYTLIVTATPSNKVFKLKVTWKTDFGTQTGQVQDANPSNAKSVSVTHVILGGPSTTTDIAVELNQLNVVDFCTEYTLTFDLRDQLNRTVDLYEHKFRILDRPNDWTLSEAEAVWNSADITMKDDNLDFGEESNTRSQTFVASKDLWIRWINDGGSTHQNAKHSFGNNSWNRVFARVRNRGCSTTQSANLHLYWTAARSFEMWKEHWLNFSSNPSVAGANWMYYGNNPLNPQHPLGGEITINTPLTPMASYNYAAATSPVSLSALAPGEVRVISPVGWRAPNPDAFKNNNQLKIRSDGWPVICLLARIVSVNDPMHNESDRDVFWNIVDNNNIVSVNTFLTNNDLTYDRINPDAPVGTQGNYQSRMGIMFINNPTISTRTVKLSFTELATLNTDTPPEFNNYGFPVLAMDSLLWKAWDDGGRQGTGISVISTGLIKVTDVETGTLTNISIASGQQHRLGVMFEYYRDTVPPDTVYNYSFSLGEYDSIPTEQIHTPSIFLTSVLDTAILDTTTAVYQKTDPTTGTNAKESSIESQFYPNPAIDNTNVFFELLESSNVSISIKDIFGREVLLPVDNKTIDAGKQHFVIDVSSLGSGIYFCEVKINGYSFTQKFVKASQ